MKNIENHGYDIPDEHITDEYKCAVIRVPNKSEYIQAFYDSWFRLTSWMAWEKDVGKRAREVSALWRVYEPRFVACDVVDEINEEGDLMIQVNVTTNCNCGGCPSSGGDGDIINVDCGGGGGTIDVSDDSPIGSDGTEIIPDGLDDGNLEPGEAIPQDLIDNGFDTWASYDAYICDFAHYVPEALARILRGIETFTDKITTIAGILSVIATLFPGAWAARAGAAALFELVEALIQLFVGETVFDSLDDLADDLTSEPLKSDIACIIYTNRYNLPIAHSKTLLKISTVITSKTWSGEVKGKIDTLVNKTLVTRWMYSEMLEKVLGRFPTGHVCSTCVGSGADDLFIDFDEYNPALTINILATSDIYNEGTNLVLRTMPHSSGNAGGGGWNMNSLVAMAAVDAMTILRVDMDIRVPDPTFDDELRLSVGSGVGAFLYDFPAGILGTTWTRFSFDMDVDIPAGSSETGVVFSVDNVGVRQHVYVDNIRIVYEELV